MKLISALKKDPFRIFWLCLGIVIGLIFVQRLSDGLLLEMKDIEDHRPMTKLRSEVIEDGVIYIPSDLEYLTINKDYLFLESSYYKRSFNRMRDHFDFDSQDHYTIVLYHTFKPDKVYQKIDLLALLRKKYPYEVIIDVEATKDMYGNFFFLN